MKRDAVKHHNTPNGVPPPQPRPLAARARKRNDRDREFIQAMNAFVDKNGTITDDEFFRVLRC